jgi:hypothetical protein
MCSFDASVFDVRPVRFTAAVCDTGKKDRQEAKSNTHLYVVSVCINTTPPCLCASVTCTSTTAYNVAVTASGVVDSLDGC